MPRVSVPVILISFSQIKLGTLQRGVLHPQGRAYKNKGQKGNAGGNTVQPAFLGRTVSLASGLLGLEEEIAGVGGVLRMGMCWGRKGGSTPRSTQLELMLC